MFSTTYESKECECGGRCNSVPSVVSRHRETKLHKNWEQWKGLCNQLIVETSHEQKRILLKQLKVLAPVISN